MIPYAPVSLKDNLHPLTQLKPLLLDVLTMGGKHAAANRISRCNAPARQCRDPYCIVCNCVRATNKRHHVKSRLEAVYEANPKAMVWATTPSILDSAVRHSETAGGMVSGIRSFTRTLPVMDWFATTEVKRCALGDSCLNIHAHTLAVLDLPAGGRGYVRQDVISEWMHDSWRTAYPNATECEPRRLVTPVDAHRWAAYLTKPATIDEYAATITTLLQDPDRFLEEAEALRGVAKYYGPMAKSRKPNTTIHRNSHDQQKENNYVQ